MMQEELLPEGDEVNRFGWFQHVPLPPFPRSDMLSEQVFARRWAEYMLRPVEGWRETDDRPNAMLRKIMGNHPQITCQRQATVCASVFTWLGTNCGQSFLTAAGKRSSEMEDAFLVEWARENKRESWLNNGLRTIEAILAPRELWIDGRLAGAPELTVYDYETVDLLMAWCGKTEGRLLISLCQNEVKLEQKRQRLFK